jgi:predicted SAM-dependent methyltransferase
VFEALAAVKTESMDVIVTFDLIEHFRKDELPPLVDEVFRVLRQGGEVAD